MKKFSKIYNFVFPDQAETKSCTLLGCGHENTTGNYRWDGNARGKEEFGIWQYTLKGRGVFEFGSKKYELTPNIGFTAIVPENSVYYLPADSEEWEFIFLTFDGQEALRLLKNYRRRFGEVIDYQGDKEIPALAFKIINESCQNKIDSPYKLSAMTYNFLMQLFNNSQLLSDNVGAKPKWLLDVQDYCIKNLSSDVTIDDMAHVANYSRYHFMRQFADFEGKTPYKYLIELRIKLAIQLLQTSNLSIKEIAEKCGFYNTAYFSKTFKEYYSVSPGSFRKSYK